MKVIGAGLSKTGTTSLNVALVELGYTNVYDYMENYVYLGTEYTNLMENGWTAETFRSMYENVDATLDGPAQYFWEDILEAFPNAKVILTVRDNQEIWFKSLERQLKTLDGNHSFVYHILSHTLRKFWKYAENIGTIGFSVNRSGMFEASPRISEIVFKQNYRRHNAYVKHVCPKDKLLVFNCKEGWEPLCKFLGKPVPNKPFPYVNPNSELSELIWKTPLFKRARREVYLASGILLMLGGCAIMMKTGIGRNILNFIYSQGTI